MFYQAAIHLVIATHFIWILFILFGFFPALRWPRVFAMHVAGLIFTLILNIGGWYCPLTHLEYHLRRSYDAASVYEGSFITNTLENLIYLQVAPVYLRAGGITWAGLNLMGYGLLLCKKRRQP